MSTKKLNASGSSKSKAKAKLVDTLTTGPSTSNPKPIKPLDTFAAQSNSKKDMFSLAPSKPKMLDMFALAPSKPKTLDLLAAPKGKNIPVGHASGNSKPETPKISKMLGSNSKPGLKPKSVPPPPPPLDRKTLLDLHYSRYLRTVLMNNAAQLEDKYARKVVELQESKLTSKKVQMEKERTAMKFENSDILEKKRNIEEAEMIENQYSPILNLSAGVNEKLEKLTNVLEEKTSTLPVLNCELSQPINHGPLEETISIMNVAMQRETEGLGGTVVRTSNDKDSIADELEKVETDGSLIHKLSAHFVKLASMEAMVNKEYSVEMEDGEDEERLASSSFTDSVLSGKVKNGFGSGSAELSSIVLENEGPTRELEYEETFPLDEDFDVDVLSLLKRNKNGDHGHLKGTN